MTRPALHHKNQLLTLKSFSCFFEPVRTLSISGRYGFVRRLAVFHTFIAQSAHLFVKHERSSDPGDSLVQQVSLILPLILQKKLVGNASKSLGISDIQALPRKEKWCEHSASLQNVHTTINSLPGPGNFQKIKRINYRQGFCQIASSKDGNSKKGSHDGIHAYSRLD